MSAGNWLAVGSLLAAASVAAMAWAMSEHRLTLVVVFGFLATALVVALMIAEDRALKKRIKEGRE